MRRLKRVLSGVLQRRRRRSFWICIGAFGLFGAVITTSIQDNWLAAGIGIGIGACFVILVSAAFEFMASKPGVEPRTAEPRIPDPSISDSVETTTSTDESFSSPSVTVSADRDPYFIKSLRAKQKQEPPVLGPVIKKSCVRHIRV